VPTYDYQCRSCGNVTEVIHPMSEDGPSVCELCGGALRRVLFPAGIIFKGSGFYSNDSRADRAAAKSGGTKPSSGGDGGEKTSSSTGSGGSSEGSSASTSKTPSTSGESKPSKKTEAPTG
jgi:putative FmdB family regulatory protein